MDLYEILGVSKDATPKEIRAAYKSLAQKYHPDKETGDAVKFKEIKEAKEILLNPDTRHEYDTTGTVNKGQTLEGRAEEIIAQIIQGIIDKAEFHGDIVARVKQGINKGVRDITKTNDQINSKLAKLKTEVGRVKVKDGEMNFYESMISAKILMLENAIAVNAKELEAVKLALEMVQEYEDTAPKPDKELFTNFTSPINTGMFT